ncbi:hypothetical protein PRIPAC_76199 [Pristionchus pacificus]|uniref:Uncharacterized protein n=1 Tax=Pristionchus pacificus TaxID=54126 RepID=A0A2A6C8A7_PRIPA|nr:hypothetical protein PRIPAC_76199 [Pristionchus pacificus]|eukprot:PDM74308.1 hypothetical protein PRIPAC_41664 [Pristionchus pacificus]
MQAPKSGVKISQQVVQPVSLIHAGIEGNIRPKELSSTQEQDLLLNANCEKFTATTNGIALSMSQEELLLDARGVSVSRI